MLRINKLVSLLFHFFQEHMADGELQLPCEKSGRISQLLVTMLVPAASRVEWYIKETIRKVQSSPGYLQVGQVKSNWTRQIPQTSSSGMSQRHDATASHCLILTFIVKE